MMFLINPNKFNKVSIKEGNTNQNGGYPLKPTIPNETPLETQALGLHDQLTCFSRYPIPALGWDTNEKKLNP